MRNKGEGKGIPIEVSVKDWAGELINDHDLEPKIKRAPEWKNSRENRQGALESQ